MKKMNHLFVIIILLSLSCQKQSKDKEGTNNKNNTIKENKEKRITQIDSGVVVLRESYENGLLSLYNKDGSKWKSFELTDNFNDKSIHPYALKPENALMVFRCVTKSALFYEVIVDENSTKFIKKSDKNFHFETWEQHIINVFSVDFDYLKNPIKVNPINDAKELSFDKEQFYHPIKINGDWLMIKDDDEKTGWIKWKNNKGQLILTLYYDA
jgi:hypothetical protein